MNKESADRAALANLKRVMTARPAPPGAAEAEAAKATSEEVQEQARRSQRAARPGEFAFEIVAGDGYTGGDFGMNVISCAVCFAFGKYDAMALVPYMCPTDDVLSDALGQGLQRSGTIALGAHRCDFRFDREGSPARLAEQFPERIKLVSK